ncbi:MAG: hypothetical protein HKN68_16935, partial [Saprospiraceae bacterium]|nr:hypothetical protein [Saprospiraceae bacterium]
MRRVLMMMSLMVIMFSGISDGLFAQSNNQVNSQEESIQNDSSTALSSISIPFMRSYITLEWIVNFSGYFSLNESSPPVMLSSFSVKANECSNTLTWSASSERNFSHFEVEKSIDGKHFITVGSVRTAGDLRSSGYTYEDLLPSDDTYYRLKMVDLDATYSYSDIKFAASSCDVTDKILHLPFNILPASSGLLVYEISGQAQINQMIVTDASGKILMSLN